MVELPRSEWDGRFAAWVGATFAILAGATLVYAATRLLGDPSLFDTTTPPGVPRDPGGPAPFVRSTNVADRIGLGTSTMVMALGIVVILAGAALAALEVRARMLGRDGGASTEEGGTGGPPSGAGSTALSGAEPGKVSGSQHRGLSARGPSSALRQIAVIIDRISQPRAVIAVLVTGGSVVLVGFFGQLHWAMRL